MTDTFLWGLEETVKIDRRRLEALIIEQDLKRWWVAEFSGIHRTTLQRWIAGTIGSVRMDSLCRVARTLSVPPERLILRR